jgi:large subunit ribosomal protein L25
MDRPFLIAELREKTGKGVARKLRAKGFVPAIFYGPRTQSIPISVEVKALRKTLQTEAGENVLIELDIKRDGESDKKVVMLKDVQIDALSGDILHADFYEIAMDETLKVEVPLNLLGKPEGTKLGGILEQIRRSIEIECLPGDIPKRIDIDVSGLKIGDSIHVRDLKIEKVKILSDPNLTIATVVPPTVEEKVAEEAVTEAVEAQEAEGKEEGKS